MEVEAIRHFVGKTVKLRYHNNFSIVGTILEVYNETILFKTNQAESLISIADIKSVVERNGDY